jgi:GT2 family glycosyltransferase
VVEKIGGLDERFGLGNFEDDDFSLRAAAAGFTSLIAKAAFVHHFGSRTFRGAKIDYRASIEKNWVIFKSKWGLPEDLALGSPCNLRPLMEQGFKPEYFFPLPVPSGAASSAEVGL